MMVRYENRCVDCGLPCMGESCQNRNLPVTYCDECGEEIQEAYEVDGEELCDGCCLSRFRRLA